MILFKTLNALFCQKSSSILSSTLPYLSFARASSSPVKVKLTEIGSLTSVKTEGKYDTGQLFLHNIFGYRGVILFPWVARVYDRSDVVPNLFTKSSEKEQTNSDVKTKSMTYYQALIDSRDMPFIRTQNESVTFLGSQEHSSSLYAIPGLDYVSHEDILPYSSQEWPPINHELFEKFFMSEPDQVPPYTARENLKSWQERNHPWLELSDICSDVTQNIRVTVIPFYMGSRESQSANTYWWRYHIRIENLGTEKVTLRERHWRIFSLSGTLETVRGKGVIGQEPTLEKENPAFQYSSHVSLQAPSGHMWGTFKMERVDGTTFEIRIPPFNLESRDEDKPTV